MSITAARQLNARAAALSIGNVEEHIWRLSQQGPTVFANWKRGGPMTCAATGEACGRLIIPDPRQVRGAVWDHSQPDYK